MDYKELYEKLLEAYSDSNLNRITGKLIELFRNKNFSGIKQIAGKISRFVEIDETKDSRFFSKLIMLYHPDKGETSRKNIERLFFDNEFEELKKYSHIFLLEDIDDIKIEVFDDEPAFDPEYSYDINLRDGYHIFSEDDRDEFDDFKDEEEFEETYEKTFYNEIKMREYGNVNVEFPPHYLEDYKEFELSESGIESLDGIEYCKHIVSLDLSNNLVSDISNLWNLSGLQELYLSNNKIVFIDTLGNLSKLRTLDLSGNQIEDISPLFDLTDLEYVNLIGNPVPADQIKILRSGNIIVMD